MGYFSPSYLTRDILMARTTTTARLTGIHADAMYTLNEFKRLGYSDSTLRAARRRGLVVRYLHKRGHIYGADWIAYVLDNSIVGETNSTSLPDYPESRSLIGGEHHRSTTSGVLGK